MSSHVATRRALGRRRTMENTGSVRIVCPCPLCDELVTCTVQGDADVEIEIGCDDRCHLRSSYPWDELVMRAADQAINVRHSYERRVAEGAE